MHVVERSLRRRIKYYSTKEGRTAVFGKRGHGLMSKDLNWAVLGTGVIANEMAAGLQKMGKTLYAVGNRTYSKAVAFAEKYGIKKVYWAIDEMFVDDNVDIIYIIVFNNLFNPFFVIFSHVLL